MTVCYQPDLLYIDGEFHRRCGLQVDEDGTISALGALDNLPQSDEVRLLPGRAMLPGMVDVHSHAFQRALRGRAESRRRSGTDFWSWRVSMYQCALALTPEEMYDVARMAFLEMLQAGITTVGEFHYVHRTPAGGAYDDPNLLSKQVIAAAEDVGIRIVLLRCAYVRAGFQLPPDPGQVRFIEPTADEFLRNAEALHDSISRSNGTVSFGIAPHSLRAVPRDYLVELKSWTHALRLPLHMHVAEQPAEIEATHAEYGAAPFAFLETMGFLTPDFTAVHAIHLEADDVLRLAEGGITIAACPTTERNLGDGILPADRLIEAGVRIAFGTDSHTQTDAMENARELESNLRLSHLQRAVLDGVRGESLPSLIFECATRAGAESLHLPVGQLVVGAPADFFTVDLRDTSIAGSQPGELLTNIVFSMSPRAVQDVAVNGKLLIDNRGHAKQAAVVEAFELVQKRLGKIL